MQRLYYHKGNIEKVDCGNGTEMMFAADTSVGEFLDYCAEVEAKGYAKVVERTIAENHFVTGQKSDTACAKHCRYYNTVNVFLKSSTHLVDG